MSHLASAALGLVFAAVGFPGAAPGEPAPSHVSDADPGPAPLSTSCQCPSVTCANGSTALACQVTCTGQASCLCAYCVAAAGQSSYVSGLNSCTCR